MPRTNKQIMRSTLTTENLGSGLLNPEQSSRFLRQTFEQAPLGNLIRHEIRRAKTGEIDKIGIARRILRKKTENVDDGYRAKPDTNAVSYATTAWRLPWEITEETLRENIEGQSLEETIATLMATQVGIDREDLAVNGDENIAAADPDHDFLYINDGWLKQISQGGHVVDNANTPMALNIFYKVLQAIPNKYNNGKLRLLMSPQRRQAWEYFLLNQAITVGGVITDKRIENPASIPVVEVPSMPNDKIILTDPKNLIEVVTYGVIIRKTTEGKEAIMQDKRFYVIHGDVDPIIEELDATAIIENLPEPVIA